MIIKSEFSILGGNVNSAITIVEEVIKSEIIENYYASASTGSVDSVNGQTGAVEIDADDIEETASRIWLTPTLKGYYDTAYSWVNQYGNSVLQSIIGLQDALSNKVDKATGYSLTKNDLSDTLKASYDSAVTWIATNGAAILTAIGLIPNKADKTAVNCIIGSYNSGASLTSVTVERKLASIYVAGGTYTTNDNMKIEALLTKIGGNGIATFKIRVSTEEEPAVITSATLLATSGGTAGNMWYPFRRHNIHIDSNSASLCHTPTSSVADDITALTVISSVAINHTIGQWYHITGQLGSGIDVLNLQKYIIYK